MKKLLLAAREIQQHYKVPITVSSEPLRDSLEKLIHALIDYDRVGEAKSHIQLAVDLLRMAGAPTAIKTVSLVEFIDFYDAFLAGERE